MSRYIPYFGYYVCSVYSLFFFFFNYAAPTEIYTLSLHDALPIFKLAEPLVVQSIVSDRFGRLFGVRVRNQNSIVVNRSEEHTSELQSRQYLVCRLLLEKKKKKKKTHTSTQNKNRPHKATSVSTTL